MRCPTCRAPWRETTECARCGSDLEPLMRVAAAAWRHRVAAMQAFAAGRIDEAMQHLRVANELHKIRD